MNHVLSFFAYVDFPTSLNLWVLGKENSYFDSDKFRGELHIWKQVETVIDIICERGKLL